MSDDAGDWEGTPASRWRLPVVLLLGVLVVAGVTAGVRSDRPAPSLMVDAAEELTPDGPVTPSPSPSPAAPPSASPAEGWEQLPPAPLRTTAVHRGVWTGQELVVLGWGEAAAYSPQTRQWRKLPPPPSQIPEDASVVWTGEEVVVWGGASWERSTDQEAGDGAGLDPVTGEWRRMSQPPLHCVEPAGAWTGMEVLYWGTACRTEDGAFTTAAAAYEPATDRWRLTQPAAVAPTAVRTLWTGSEVVAWGDLETGPGMVNGFTVAYDPVADAWRELPPPPLDKPSDAVGIWTGSTLVLWNSNPKLDPASSPHTGALLDPGSEHWRPLGSTPASPSAESRPYGFTAVWTGERMLIAGGYPTPVDLSYDPVTGNVVEIPGSSGARVRPVVVWTGEQLLVWGGYTIHGPAVDLIGWTPSGRGVDEHGKHSAGRVTAALLTTLAKLGVA